MQKKFEIFKTEEDALEYKRWLMESWITDIANMNDCEENDVEDFIDVHRNTPRLWAFTNEDCSVEVEIEVSELDVSKIEF